MKTILQTIVIALLIVLVVCLAPLAWLWVAITETRETFDDAGMREHEYGEL